MRNLIFLFLCVSLGICAGNDVNSSDTNASDINATEIKEISPKERVEAILGDIASGVCNEEIVCEKKYFSRNFARMVDKTDQIFSSVGDIYEAGQAPNYYGHFWEYYKDAKSRVKSARDINASLANVRIGTRVEGGEVYSQMILVKERGEWLIDNVKFELDEDTIADEMEFMREYILQNSAEQAF